MEGKGECDCDCQNFWMMLEGKGKCDCLNFCGDDPRLYNGTVTPCSNFFDGTIKTKKKLVEKWVLDAAILWDRHPTLTNLKKLTKLVAEYEGLL